MRRSLPSLLLTLAWVGCAQEEPDRLVVTEGPARTCAAPGPTPAWDRMELPDPHGPSRRLVGSGLIVVDLDDDGLPDLVQPGPDRVTVWRQASPRAFVDVTSQWIPDDLDLSATVGGSAADADGDGDPDLILVRHLRPDVLLLHEGDHLVDATATSGLADTALDSVSAAWADMDGDGWLDLAIGTYATDEPLQLWRALGDGRFEDASDRLGERAHHAKNFMTAWLDLERDGFPDLFVPNDFFRVNPPVLLANRDGVFSVDDSAGYHPGFHGMGIAFADLDDDDLPDVVETTYRAVSVLRSLPSGTTEQGLLWVRANEELGVSTTRDQVFGWGVAAEDLDNDGDHDIVAGFGVWDRGDPNPEEQPDALWLQVAGHFERQPDSDPGPTRGLLVVDVDADGWLDVVKRRLDGVSTVDFGRCGESHWTTLALERPATHNRRAIGATVHIEAGGRRQVRWVGAGSTSMFSGGPPEVHFGLGTADRLDRVEIDWSDGRHSEVRDLPVDRLLTITFDRR
ncbi:MAG: CRTAC1 family protein [Myxococcales bacterium]|nr:CRTAC1 family protein [Myxococcales bacterium]